MINRPFSEQQIKEAMAEFEQFMGFPDNMCTSDFMNAAAQEVMLEIRADCMHEVDALLAAGWKYELPEIVNRKEFDQPRMLDTEPWQWYWRRPPRRKNSKGKRFLSTAQAYNALKKEQNTND